MRDVVLRALRANLVYLVGVVALALTLALLVLVSDRSHAPHLPVQKGLPFPPGIELVPPNRVPAPHTHDAPALLAH